MPRLVQPLPDGPLDLIGDVHGERDALERLLERLGCDPQAGVAERPLVFVGDLIDRGPDSPGVVRVVRRLVEAGLAWCVAGNHELNLLADDHKEGNGWFFGQPDRFPLKHPDGRIEHRDFPSVRLEDPTEQAALRAFLAELPLALVRDDLRVVHACWHPQSLSALPEQGAVAELSEAFYRQLQTALTETGDRALAHAERAEFAELKDRSCRPDRALPGMLALSLAEQAGNPIKVLTSGLEERVDAVEDYFYVGGKWRVVQRSRWWDDYQQAPAVVVGHYWRRRAEPDPGKHDLWDTVPPFGWAGPRGNVFCVDYSVGRRFVERWDGKPAFAGGLAALRWPERTLVFDDRDGVIQTTGFGG